MLDKEDKEYYPWSVYVDDLEVFLLALKQNIKGSTSRFLNFLKLRGEMHGRMYAVDELYICATYLQNPEKFRQYSKFNDTFLTFSHTNKEILTNCIGQINYASKKSPYLMIFIDLEYDKLILLEKGQFT